LLSHTYFYQQRPEVDRRSEQSPIKDQGQRGTCVAFAATAGHEMLRHEEVDLSEEFLRWAAKQRDGLPSSATGTTLAAAAAALAAVGQPPEELWPYDGARDDRTSSYQPTKEACDAAAVRRADGGGLLLPTTQGLRQALDRSLAVLLGIRIHLPWYVVTHDGLIQMPAPTANSYAGHAVLIVGYRNGDETGGGAFIVRNSWGTDWGAQGYGFLPYAYVDSYGIEAWGLAIGSSKEAIL